MGKKKLRQEPRLVDESDIWEGVREELQAILGCDIEDLTPEKSLFGDLDFDSLEILNIQLRLENLLSNLRGQQVEVRNHELFPRFALRVGSGLTKKGELTEAGVRKLRDKMPHINLRKVSIGQNVGELDRLVTVESLFDFVKRKLGS